MVPVADLKPNPRNPNKHPAEQVRLLAKNIEHHGWRLPITVSNRSGLIVRGHARLLAAQRLGLAEAPVSYQDYATEEAELADLLTDNRLAELAEMDNPGLKDLLEELDTGALDMELTGFTEGELERLMSQFHIPERPRIEDLLPNPELRPASKTEEWFYVEYYGEGERFARLSAVLRDCGALTGEHQLDPDHFEKVILTHVSGVATQGD